MPSSGHQWECTRFLFSSLCKHITVGDYVCIGVYLFLVQHVELVSVSDAERAAPAGGVVGVAIQRSVRPGTRRHTPSICQQDRERREKGRKKERDGDIELKSSLH